MTYAVEYSITAEKYLRFRTGSVMKTISIDNNVSQNNTAAARYDSRNNIYFFASSYALAVTPSALDIALAPRPSIIGVFGITSTTFALSIV